MLKLIKKPKFIKPKSEKEKPNLKAEIENPIYNQKGKIQKVNLKIENEFYTIEECKIIYPMNDSEDAFTPGMMLYEKTESKLSNRFYLGDKTSQIFVTQMVKRKNFNELFSLKHYMEGFVLKGNEGVPIVFPSAAVDQIKTYRGLTTKKSSSKEIFKSQGDTAYQTKEGDHYVGYFTEKKSKINLYLKTGEISDKLSIWSIEKERIAKAAYQQECEKCPYLDKDGNLILDKWKEFLKTKQNSF